MGVSASVGGVWIVVVVGCSLLIARIPQEIQAITYQRFNVDTNHAAFQLCPPETSYLPSTHLHLPHVYCAYLCSTLSNCKFYLYRNNECQFNHVTLTSGYSAPASPGVEPGYQPYSSTTPRQDVAYLATVTASSNLYDDYKFEDMLTSGILCTRRLPNCPCTLNATDEYVTVDLGQTYYIKEMRIYAADPAANVSENFNIHVGSGGSKDLDPVVFVVNTLPTGLVGFIRSPNREGRYITFSKTDGNSLCLCFLQVFGQLPSGG